MVGLAHTVRPDPGRHPGDGPSGRRIGCPALALWGSEGFVGRTYDVLGIWNDYAGSVEGEALPCDHYLPEEAPEATTERLRDFLRRHASR